jgi:predicted lysophospholipase L1 biosynthesis ABC-type transport system permease subunit
VVGDVKADGQRETAQPTVYYALAQHPEEYVRNLYARVAISPGAALESIRRAINAVAPQLAVREVVPLGELSERTVATERMIARLAAVFGLLGMTVAIVGLYGAIAYSVARRTNEIGVRLALGASPASVRRLVMRETAVVVVAGLLVGVGLALPSGALAESMLFGLSPRDVSTYALAGALIVAVGLLVGAIPAWRASRVNPVSALRM